MKILRYLRDLLRHKYYVFLEACKLEIPIRGFFHDSHKFWPQEFFEYAKVFGAKVTPRGKAGYDANAVNPKFAYAWLHHQHHSKHHWEFWLSVSKGQVVPLEIPEKYLKEMLADMRGSSRANKGLSPLEYYKTNRHKYMFHSNTRKWLEEQLGYKEEEEQCQKTV